MFLDWKNQRYENDSTTQSNLQIQCNPYQTTTGSFHRTRTKSLTIRMETQKTLNREGGREGDARGKRYGNICICITDSLCYKAETNTPL